MGVRKSGIKGIGDIPWGAHISHVFQTKDEYLRIFVPCIKEGLLNNELCVWIYSLDVSYQELIKHMKKEIVNVEQYIINKQLQLIQYNSWYIENKSFNELRVNKRWLALIKYALDNGYDGLRAIGETSWLEKSYMRSFSVYEKNINALMAELPFIAICLYDASKINLYEFAEIINNHTYNIIEENNEFRIVKNVELLIKGKQLDQSRENYKNLLRLLPDAVFIHNERKILYYNEAATRLLGVDKSKNIAGRSLFNYIIEDQKEEFQDYISGTINSEDGSRFFRGSLKGEDGNIIDFEAVASHYTYYGIPTALAVVRDISHLKKIAELQNNIEKNKELLNETLEYDKIKTEFFSNLSHELRTPLNVILSALQLIETYKLSNNKTENENNCLKIIKQNCYRLLRLVNNLIDITKIDSEFFKLDLINCNIVQLIEEVTLSVSQYTESRGLTLQFDTDTEEKILACDPDQIERIMLNLLSNAIKFTPEGGRIWVKISDMGDEIVVSVRDSGIGIPQEKQRYIFNKFQQVNKSLTRQFEGSGIGLSLVKSLVEKHGGKVSLKSKVGSGSEFILEFPCKKPTESIYHWKKDGLNNSHVERLKLEFSDLYSFI